MKILVVSDSHGRNENLLHVIQKVSPIDLIIHLGDLERSEDIVREFAPCPVEMVRGNNDYNSELDKEKVITVGAYTLFLTHGDRYHVGYNLQRLQDAARYIGAGIAMFGHTHMPLIRTETDVTLINPGSISLPRQEGRIPTYIIMELDHRGEIHYTLNYVRRTIS